MTMDVVDETGEVFQGEKVIGDYWSGKPAVLQWFFPDGVQYLEYSPLTYGERKAFQTATAQDINMQRNSQEVKIRTNIAKDNHELIVACTRGWKMIQNGKEIGFSKGSLGSTLEMFLAQFQRPEILDKYVAVLRKINPWLLSEASAKEISDQIEELKELYVVALEREAGK